MGKNTHFTGQPIFNQIISFLDKPGIKKIASEHKAEWYVKKFSTYNHLIVMLFTVLEGYHSIREVILGLLANAHKLKHLGLDYLVKRSTLSEANIRRSSKVFEEIYGKLYESHHVVLADSRLNTHELKRLYVLDSTTITLFSAILKGVGRNPKEGRKKGGIKAHTIIKASEHVPCLVRFSAASIHDHNYLSTLYSLPKGSIITFDKGYVDYGEYQRFTEHGIFYVTRLKDNAVYKSIKEFDIPDLTDSRVLRDEKIELLYKQDNDDCVHVARRIAYWDNENQRLFEFITNDFELQPEQIALIYRKRWQIELLFRQLKQNFPLKYFLGDNQNAIEIQIWAAMTANFLLSVIQSKVERKWAFSNLVSVIRQMLMSYISLYKFLENPEGAWNAIIEQRQDVYANSLFPQ
ncbi:MAG TPA: IS4 family transposase [Arachidicoccus soli]|nr:IS4 family transposase [Arachidicoccus soli]